MTHTLHRQGPPGDLKADFVLLIMPARGVNLDGSQEIMRQIWEVISHYEADLTNFGNARNGNSHKTSMDALKKADSRIAHAVFKDRETVKACLLELKARDFGISVVLSGLLSETEKLCAEIGLSPHTVEYSLGVHGNSTGLPDENVLEITTMCGHAMVAPNLVLHLLAEINAGRMTHAEAAEDLSRMCDCGVFNPRRAEGVLRKITS